MAQKILSEKECSYILDCLSSFNKDVDDYCADIDKSIELFSKIEIVQSFFASGSFGKEMEEELIKVKNSVLKYRDSLTASNGLIPVTKKVVDEQLSLLRQGGGSN